MGRVFGAILAIALAAAGQGAKTPDPPTALNRVFHGQVVGLKGRTVTLFYDFEDPIQLQDFEAVRPMRLLDASQNRARIENGRLVLEGSTSIRHKMESGGEIRACFTVRPGKLHNVGAVITEAISGQSYVVYNLFDYRFNRSGHMHIGAVGLHEDEGAEDSSTGLVNYRDIFSRDLRKTVKAGEDLQVEVSKNRWKEYFAVGRVKGKGSSKGKTKDMKDLHLGLFVHNSTASFDDLTITCTLSDEYLHLEDLSIDLVGKIDQEIEAYSARGLDAPQIVSILGWPWLGKANRKAAAKALADRKDPKILRLLLPALRSSDRTSRQLAIDIVEAVAGQTFGYSAADSASTRTEAIARLVASL